jgi:quercetin dioxygenase-like cupin family protein
MGTVHRFIGRGNQFEWEGVTENHYDAPDVVGVVKKVLLGPSEGARDFRIRYFHVEPGGNTSLDQHAHDHGVIILHGSASALLGEEEVVLGPWDVVHVPGDEIHQFRALGDDPLGFICVIPPVP